MKTQTKFWWFVLVAFVVTVGIFAAILLLFWRQLDDLQQQTLLAILKEDFVFFFMAGVLFFTAFGFTLDWFFRFYIVPVNQLAEETQIVATVNPQHRIVVHGSSDVVRLSGVINQSAQRFATIQADVQRQLKAAETATETEKNILAALLEGLPQGIIVCNTDGHIVFFNRKVKTIFERHGTTPAQWIGLGRSVYSIVDSSLIQRGIERIERNLAEGRKMFSERFLMGTNGKITLPAELVPVLDSRHLVSGFIIYIEDSVEKFKKEQDLFTRLQSWQHKLIQSISVIKASSEVIKDRSYESEADRQQLVQILCHESEVAAKTLSDNDNINAWYPNRPWPLTPVDAGEWCRYLAHRSGNAIGVDLEIENQTDTAQISVDIHHLTNALLFVVGKIARKSDLNKIQGRFYLRGAWLYMDIVWPQDIRAEKHLNRWKEMIPVVQEQKLDLSLGEILRLHGAKLWTSQPVGSKDGGGLRLLIPALERAEVVTANGQVAIIPDSRPEYYDFDLFHQNGQTTEMDHRRLADLTYTVFDTEATGLDPQGGDEIISIGALRIVNGRVLCDDCFDQLVNPMRDIGWASIKYHGLQPEMLKNQPTIEKVLPAFHQFTQGTVLVGHNVAFDMKMLQMKEAATGIIFTNPVIDTMLLSAVAHPAHTDHSLEAIAQRLGVMIVNRHTAVGDAKATGEVFIKLISILARNGIITLLQARRASEKTYYARLKY